MDKFYDAYNQEIEFTREQEECLNYHLGDKTLLIKGYAGTGKSMMLQAMAIQYINMYPKGARKHKIGFFTFTNSLATTSREYFDANEGGDDIDVCTVDKYLYDVFKALGGVKPHYLYDNDSKKYREDNIKKALETHEKRKGHNRLHDLSLKFWADEFDWMKGMNVSGDDKNYYLSLNRTGRGEHHIKTPERPVMYEIYQQYLETNKLKHSGDWADFALYINKKLKTSETIGSKNPIPDELMFDLIFIDEAQDLSLTQMLALMGIYRKGMIIAMDAHQRIYAANWSLKQLGIEAQTQWLRKSKRNTIEIDALAESLRKKNDEYLGEENKSKRAIPEDHGPKPIICGFSEPADEKEFVINQLKKWTEGNSAARVAIIGATNKQVEKYSVWCTDAGIHHEVIQKGSTFSMKTPGIKIVSAHSSKGLEFHGVIIPEFIMGNYPFNLRNLEEDEKNNLIIQFRSLAYVAMTRAKKVLAITYSGKNPSPFLSEMNDAFYDFYGSSPKQDANSDLATFLRSKGLTVYDKRPKGNLTVAGQRDKLEPIISEARKKFGNIGGGYKDSLKALQGGAGWWTHCDK